MAEKIEFSHRSVLLDECIEGLDIKPDGIYLDGTAGGGGLVDSDKEAYGVSYNNISFITSEAKKEWVEPLTRLLTNVKSLWEIDPEAEDDGEQYILYGYYVGLLDIDMNDAELFTLFLMETGDESAVLSYNKQERKLTKRRRKAGTTAAAATLPRIFLREVLWAWERRARRESRTRQLWWSRTPYCQR